MKIDWNIK